MKTIDELEIEIENLKLELANKDVFLDQVEKQNNALMNRLDRLNKLNELCEHTFKVTFDPNNASSISSTQLFDKEKNPEVTEYIVTLVKCGVDFKKMMAMIKHDPTVMDAWNNFLLTMRLCGLDDSPQPNNQ